MQLVLIGMNHKTAPVDIRERLQFSCGEGDSALTDLLRLSTVREAVYFATCNRVEVLARVTDNERSLTALKTFILQRGNLSPEELERCLYVHLGQEAVRHLFRVTASLDSLVIGEPQILGQVKAAYRRALDCRGTGVLLNRLIHHAFRVAKRIRTETGIAANAVSVSYAAVELGKKIFGGLREKTVLLIGAGEMAELAARHLIHQKVGRILITNRTPARAEELAALFQGQAVPFDQRCQVLPEVDIVIASTGAPEHILTAGQIAETLRGRNRSLLLIDIAVPRDIDPAAGEIDNVFLHNIDHLQELVAANRDGRKNEALKAEEIISEEIVVFEQWFNTLEAVPTIVALREKMESIAKGELERSSAWLNTLSDEDRGKIEILAASIVNKILHEPTVGLKDESQEKDVLPFTMAITKLFKL